MAKKDFNLIAIGGGSAGLVTSYIAAMLKAKVALIEKHKMGGDCLNTGCVPSKALIRTAKILSYIKRHNDYGIKHASAEFDFSTIMERVQKVIQTVEPHDSIERYTSLGVDCITGSANIKSSNEVEVNGKILTTNAIVIATGARPYLPPIPGLDQVDPLTSDTVWDLREKPKSLLVLGGGPIGSELTQCFGRLGCKVTQVERQPRLLNREDPECGDALYKRFTDEGIDVRLNSECKSFFIENGKRFAVIEKDGQEEKIEFDRVLVALGRQANSKGFGLEDIGVQFTQRGTVEVDDYLRSTTHSNIYACGDVAGPYQFTHTAAHQAWYCAVNALFSPFKKFKADYRVIPWCTFTDPEVARVGINETKAKQQGIPHEVTTYGIDDLDRAIADSEAEGFVKVITPPGKSDILGVTIMGYHAGDLLAEYALAMKHGLGLKGILSTIHTYPTMAEANKFAAGVWGKNHLPDLLIKISERLHTFRRG